MIFASKSKLGPKDLGTNLALYPSMKTLITTFSILAGLISASPQARASIPGLEPIGKLVYKQIARAVDQPSGTVCYIARSGSNGGGGSAVKCMAANKNLPSSFKVLGEMDYGEITRIRDEENQVNCVIVAGGALPGGISIDCLQ